MLFLILKYVIAKVGVKSILFGVLLSLHILILFVEKPVETDEVEVVYDETKLIGMLEKPHSN